MDAALVVLSDAGVLAGAAMLVVAAVHDVMARTVPNGYALAIAAAGLVAQAALSMLGAGDFFISLPAALVVFVLAALLWRHGLMGGGDVKLFGASALLVPPMLVPAMIAAITMAGGVLALLYLLTRQRVARPGADRPAGLLGRVLRVERWRLRRGGPLPYAVAIASGVVFVLFRGGLQ